MSIERDNHTETRHAHLAYLVIGLLIAFAIAGPLWYGDSPETRQRIWDDLIERPEGPFAFRLICQPLMAVITAVSDGFADAKAGNRPYLSRLVASGEKRGPLLFEGIVATARLILMGLLVDMFYQFYFLKTFYPGEGVIVAVTLCFVPYLLLRGPADRLAHGWNSRRNRS